MDFFKAVFTPDLEPLISEDSSRSPPIPDDDWGQDGCGNESLSPSSTASADGGRGGIAGGWNFGGLVKTLATKSEFVIQTCSRELANFGSVLTKETAAFREATARALRDLPDSLDAGAAVAQESLESVGQVVDDVGASVWRGTAEIINHGKEAILSMEAGGDSSVECPTEPGRPSSVSSSRQYNRYELLLLSIQSNIRTFLEDPASTDFNKWRSEFDLSSKKEEIKNLCSESVALDGYFNELVPDILDYTTFWCRYYYRLHKLRQAEDARAELVKRVVSREEEDLSWAIDDDDERDGEKVKKEEKIEGDIDKNRDIGYVEEGEDKNDWNAHSMVVDSAIQKFSEVSQESCEDSDFSIISSYNSAPEEDDLGWDEIEELAEHDEKSGGSNEILPRVHLHNRLSAPEEDEDLSWAIEDDYYHPKP